MGEWMSRGIIAGVDWEMEGLGILDERGKCVIGKGWNGENLF
jgi:hypothetical protein